MRAGDVVVSLKYKNISLLTYPFRLASCDREEEKPDSLSIHLASGIKNLHKLVRSYCRMGAGTDSQEDQTSNNNDQ